MAKDEMETITEDRWDEDIWGIEHEEAYVKDERPKLIFYFGENVRRISSLKKLAVTDEQQDHWVANHTRDALIAARGAGQESKSSKPIMLIDENGIDHGFCISRSLWSFQTVILTVLGHSESIAEKVKIWIDSIMEPQK
jgi:hypothetical protein